MRSQETDLSGQSFTSAPEDQETEASQSSQERQPLLHPTFDNGRSPVSEVDFWNKYHHVSQEDVTVRDRVKNTLKSVRCCPTSKEELMKMVHKRIPATSWMPEYETRVFKSDLMAALTIAVFSVPQSMSYGILAGLPPQYGLYTSTFPCIVYAFLGTSRQLSLGAFSVTSLLSREAVTSIVGDGSIDGSTTNIKPEFIEASIALCFIVGVLQLLMGILRMSVVTLFLSEALLSGYTCAAAFNIATTQIKQFAGITAPRYDGPGGMFRTWGWYLKELPNWNPADFVCGLIGVLLLLAIRQINIRYKEKLFMPIPGELIVCSVAILTSWLGDLEHAVGLSLLGDVQSGLPTPSVPKFDAGFSTLVVNAIPMAIIGFVISISVAKTFGKQHGNATSASQELYAYGASAIFGSFFHSITPSGSLSCSAVANGAGMKTQLAALMQSGILMMVLLFATPAFAYLPTAILGAVIMVAVRGLMLQIKDAKTYARVKIDDFYVWVISFVGALVFSLTYGIVIALGANLAVIVIRTSRPSIQLLGWIPDTEIYRDIDRVAEAVEVKGVSIMRFNSSIYYSNSRFMMEHCIRVINNAARPIHSFVLDFNPVNDIDTAGVKMMVELQEELRRRQVTLYLAVCKSTVRDVLLRCGFYDNEDNLSHIFVSLHDAVVFACHSGVDGPISPASSDSPVSPHQLARQSASTLTEEGRRSSFRLNHRAVSDMLHGADINISMMNAADSDTDDEMYHIPLSMRSRPSVPSEGIRSPNRMPYAAHRHTYAMELPVIIPQGTQILRPSPSIDSDS
eukprot:Clim_evm1s10 gene=Clim_evmTU1s10